MDGPSSEYNVPCILMQNNEFSDLTVAVLQVEMTSEPIYTLKTSPFDWNVRRQHKELKKLWKALKVSFPGICFPPFPPKPHLKGLSESEQCAFCAKSLNKLHRIAEIKNSLLLINFLRCGTFILEGKNRTLKTVESTSSLSGSQLCDSEEKEQFIQQITTYVKNSEYTYNRLNQFSVKLLRNLQTLSNSIKRLSELLQQAAILEPNKGLYCILAEHIKQWTAHEESQRTSVAKYLNFFSEYEAAQASELLEVLKARESALHQLGKNQGNIESHNMFGFLNAKCQSEAVRVLAESHHESLTNFIEFAQERMKQHSEWVSNHSTLQKTLQSLFQDNLY